MTAFDRAISILGKAQNRDVHGGAVAVGFWKGHRGSGAVASISKGRGAAAAGFQPRWTSLAQNDFPVISFGKNGFWSFPKIDEARSKMS